MRILIANHVDASLLPQADQRAFVQRALWFARDHDLVILPSPVDSVFLDYVAGLTGLHSQTLKVHVTAPGRHNHKLFDPDTLLERKLLSAVAGDATGVTEIFALWPSAQVAQFAELLGLSRALPGAAFFAQQGDELANNKGNFRAFAAALGVPIAEGAVCRTREHAVATLQHLLQGGPAMVKQVHNHAGNGNELLVVHADVVTSRAGAIRTTTLQSSAEARTYFEERWAWASANGCFPVVIERFQAASRTIYAEFQASDGGVSLSATGSLGYTHGRLTEETIPLRGISTDVVGRLIHFGSRLACLYHSFGYRGCLSADAVADEAGRLIFTEMNARVGGSLHVYGPIGHRIVDVWRTPERSVVQYVTGSDWKIPSIASFIAAAKEMGLAYDHSSRKGVIVTMPMAGEPNRGGFLFCVSYEDESEARHAYDRLGERFAQVRT